MSYVTLPAVGSQIYVLPLGSGYLPASALALSDGTTIGASNPLPITGSLTISGSPTVVLGAGSAVVGAVTQSGGPWSVSWSTAQHVIVDSATLGVLSVSPQSGSTWDVSDRAGRALGAVSITGTLPAFASAPTVVLGAGSAAIGSVSVTSSALPTGAATSALQGAGLPAALGAGGGLKIDGSGTALPISAASLPLPTNAAQDRTTAAAPSAVRLSDGSAFISTLPVSLATLPALTTGSATIGAVNQGTAGASAWKVDGSGVTQPVSGSVTALSAATVSAANSTSTPLGAGGTFTGTSVDVLSYAQITVFAYSDVGSATGGLAIQFSTNGTNWDDTQTRTVSAGVATHLSVPVLARYARVTYTNGSSAQGTFRLQTLLHDQPLTATVADVDAVPVSGDQVLLTQSLIVGKTTGGGGGYVAVKVNPSGALAADVTGTVTANIGTTNGLALDATLTGGTQIAQVRSGAKGASAAAAVTSTASGADHQALDVALYDASGARLGTTTNRLITQPHDGTNPSFPAGAAAADAATNTTIISQIGARLASYNGSTWDRVRSAVTAIGSTFTGMLSVLPIGIYNSSRTTRTTGQGGPLETDSTGALLVNATDANGLVSGIVGSWDTTTNGGSAMPAAGFVVKASAGSIAAVTATNGTGGTAFLQIHNSASASGLSASTLVYTATASTTSAGVAGLTMVTGGVRCSAGIVVVWSTTQFTYTAVASNTGTGVIAYR